MAKAKRNSKTKHVAPRRKRVSFRNAHPFFKERGIDEAFMVIRIDDYSKGEICNANGRFFKPVGIDPQRGNTLWPTREQAIHAAQWAVGKWPSRQYAVLRWDCIVQPLEPRIKVDKV